METINNIELRDETIYPDKNVLRSILDKSYESYAALLEVFNKNGLLYEWRYYRDGKAWLCKVQKKKRTIVWMSAWKEYMQATVYFPEKHLEKVYLLDVCNDIKMKIKSTKNVGKLKPCIFEIKDKNILTDFLKVMKLKIECK